MFEKHVIYISEIQFESNQSKRGEGALAQRGSFQNNNVMTKEYKIELL